MRKNWMIAWALFAAASAWGSAPEPGRYTASCTGTEGSRTARTFTADVDRREGRTFARLVSQRPGENYYEDWIWTDDELFVKQHLFVPGPLRDDLEIHQEVCQFSARADGGRYHIHCQDPTGPDCDMGFDPRSYWVLSTGGSGFSWVQWGPSATGIIPLQRLEFRSTR